jgi:hypothetical protein
MNSARLPSSATPPAPARTEKVTESQGAEWDRVEVYRRLVLFHQVGFRGGSDPVKEPQRHRGTRSDTLGFIDTQEDSRPVGFGCLYLV